MRFKNDLDRVWRQGSIPVVLRRTGEREKQRVRLPFSSSNREWLESGEKSHAEWIGDDDKKYWEIPKSWFNRFVEKALRDFGKVYVIQPYNQLEVCARSCRNAQGHICECSCMGANHGQGDDGTWFDVTEAFSVRRANGNLACRLLVRKSTEQ